MSKLLKISTKRGQNPVNNYFVYNEGTRKSICQVCQFAMAGKHSENLMRHLKRKHPSAFAEVMEEKQRRREPFNQMNQMNQRNQRNQMVSFDSAETGSLSSILELDVQPHNLFVKSEKLAFRLDEPGQRQIANGKASDTDYDDPSAGGNGPGHGPFDAVNIEKEELCEVVYSSDGLNESSESYNSGDSPHHAYFYQAKPNVDQAKPNVDQVSPPGGQGQANAGANGSDDASFLRYLGDKFAKYTPFTKYTVQYHINRILYKADMGCYNDADPSKLPDSFL